MLLMHHSCIECERDLKNILLKFNFVLYGIFYLVAYDPGKNQKQKLILLFTISISGNGNRNNPVFSFSTIKPSPV